MMRCWCCDYPFATQQVERDGMLRGRNASDGGPFRAYRCPQCNRESKIERSSAGRWFASPEQEYGIADYLFGWIEWLSPSDFLKIARWQRRYTDRRRLFFEADGDRHYSKASLVAPLLSWFAGSGPEVDLDAARHDDRADTSDEGEEAKSESHREEPRRRRRSEDPRATATPHPYRILGIPNDADATQIRTAFRELVRRHHPDKLACTDSESLERANRKLRELLEAYEQVMAHAERTRQRSRKRGNAQK